MHAAIAEEPPTPIWELILEQFKDQLVIILLGSAAISFVLALFEDEGGWSAFVDPAVVSRNPLMRFNPTSSSAIDLASLGRFLPFSFSMRSLASLRRAVPKAQLRLFRNTRPMRPA